MESQIFWVNLELKNYRTSRMMGVLQVSITFGLSKPNQPPLEPIPPNQNDGESGEAGIQAMNRVIPLRSKSPSVFNESWYALWGKMPQQRMR